MQHHVENQQTLARTTLGCCSKSNSSTLVQMFQLPSDTVEKVTEKNRRRNSNGFVKADDELGVKGCGKVIDGTEFEYAQCQNWGLTACAKKPATDDSNDGR